MYVSRLPLIACVVLGLSLTSQSALAQQTDPQPSPKETLEDAARMVIGALRMIIQAVPQYEAPVVLENGDILIRRKHEPNSPNGTEDKPADGDRI